MIGGDLATIHQSQAMGEWCELYACDFIMSTGDNIYDDGVTNEKCPPGHVTHVHQ